MSHLKNFITSPPGGWRFMHPGGFCSVAITFQSLIPKVATYRANRSLPAVSEGFASLVGEVEAGICAALSPQDQAEYCQGNLRVPTIVGWRQVMSFLKWLGSWVQGGRELVPQEEAERRAAICSTCPFNVGLGGCGICRTTVRELRERLMKRSTTYDSKLEACGVCGCDNKTQVHVPLESLKAKSKVELPYPTWCWQADTASKV